MSVKIIQISRKRAGLPHKEFCDYFYQNHGAISANVPRFLSLSLIHSPSGHPLHSQIHFFDTYVKTVTGPDAIKFIDFSAGVTVLALEVYVISGLKDDIGADTASGVLAVAVRQPGVDVEATLTPQLTALLQASLGSGLVSLQANYAAAPEQAQSLAKYFGKQNGSPELAAVYVTRLQDATLIPKFREAQKKFQDEAAGVLNVQNCFVALGRRAQFDPAANRVRTRYDSSEM
ncbi:hypothetical protein M427DRAFT_47618 [Gonapodya prolifera JEL478]|uniref:EthD domain-containing protein n=1 Tax=Gonapodya prolifera (strain JEL478) TaxID=1344416 RepID=A0A139A2H1_GONPJ|nr:hypothetical protein M427DRAFT_47618 [Gonapodya prolifera JEL478]|eukprot:KXS10962.1 hypothetical protein M427DRAFT_47618 [Gonapodya prolifera JEL478]